MAPARKMPATPPGAPTSSLTIDPIDDCTFWFAGEHLPADGTLNWRTRVATFALPGCGTPANDFAISANPTSFSAGASTPGTTRISTSVVSGAAESLALSVTGAPAGATASFNPATITTGGSSVLTVIGGTATPGSYTLTVTATSASTQQSVPVSVTITPPDFTIGLTPASRTMPAGSSRTFAVSTTAVNGSTQTIALSVTGLPAGVNGSFSPASVTAGGTSALTVTAAPGAPPSMTTFTVTGTAGATTHSATASLTVGGGFATPLENNVPMTGLTGASSSMLHFVLNVPPGQTLLTFTMTGGPGDADLYVRRGSRPTLNEYHCRPYTQGSNETCTFNNPAAGDWFVMIHAYSTYTNVTLKGFYQVGNVVPLANGVSITGLSGAVNSQRFFTLTVPAGQTSLVFRMTAGSGDADLYVRFGAQPTTTSYMCRPYLNGLDETCSFSNPAAGDWFVMIRGFTSYSNVTLTGTYAFDPTPVLTNGVPIAGISGTSGSQQVWRLTVPAGRPNLVFRISGGSGDADLYVRFGSRPTTTTYNCRPYTSGNSETCTFSNPQAGDWYVMIRGYTSFSGVTLSGTGSRYRR